MAAGRPPRVTLGQHSLAGVGSAVNQDFHGAMLPEGSLRAAKGIALALADGIGSSRVSQVASAAAVRGFLEDYYATSDAWSVRRAAQRVLGATNSWLHAQTMRSDARFDKDSGYVCTFSALILKGRELHLLHVGDARIYRVHASALEQLTDDHRVHVSSVESYLGRALGAGPNVEIDYRCWEAEAGEVYLLATDGAHAHLDAAAVNDALARCAGDLDAAALRLVQIARARGGQDDATVQLLRIDELPAPDAPALPLEREGLALPPALAPRDRFEGFTLVREIHLSSRSHVYLATDDASGRPAVLKLPSVDLREDAAYLDRFVLEEWVARRIDSPHVLKAWPLERTRGHLFVAMEYVEGQTLAQWMVDHPRPSLDSVRAIVAQLARGLQAMHGKEMLHQDLRPENAMIDRAGTVKLIDLGATHVAGLDDGGEPRALAIEGTPQYTAPEYFTGQGGTARSDLFSLAVIAYRMLSGQLPYGLQASRIRGTADAHRLRYVPLRQFRPELPAWVDAVLQKALHPQPAKRQQAVSEFAHDLQSPGAEFLRARAPALIERRPVLFWQCTTVLLAVAVVVLLGLRAFGR
ncbi:protein kinase [Variovorax paradoxus]|jgi:serine/threonine protein phosphatase PrpC|uniref:bifunctional protein-serine/threonine kinase/phosphatase n=1 Tax=Variovorax paradoxus TaxID=34073 RepID=UPI0006E6BBA2|nr:protein kinase [Variovorax paradoxus]KPV11715.1 protein kinase [Variovorax paradoxus]KPV13342.1 protein kinase [Variovorax paradoxus]KPV20018.1 protein kinase [Variovorax paradoxus]KPV34827.1 protein kinase [Variovorax paradoxus]